jgi:hypothetical protein
MKEIKEREGNYSFLAFASCMGILIMFVLGLVVWSAGYFWGWWSV